MTSVLIEHIDAIIVDLPTIRPHKLAMHTMQQQTLVVLRLRCSDGVEGIGEATTIGGLAYGYESPEGIKANIDAYLAPALIGLPQTTSMPPCSSWTSWPRATPSPSPASKAPCSTPRANAWACRSANCWVAACVTAWKWPGPWPAATPPATSPKHSTCWTFSKHRVFKLKIGANPVAQDLKHVVAIKRELGDSASVRVDVNQYWDESQAIRACQVLGDNGIDLIEQPISRINRAGQVRLNQRSPAPIMADESIESVEDAFSLAADGAASIFALKIAKNGGPRAVLRTAQIAEAAGIALYGGTMLEGSIGTLASAHAFLTLRQLTWGTELFGPLLLTEEIVNEPPQYRDFQLHIPHTPGLGLTLDEQRLARFARR